MHDNEINRNIEVTVILSLLVQNRQQTHDWTLIGSGAIGIGIQVCACIGFSLGTCKNIYLKGILGI